MDRILIIKLGALGDFIQAFGPFQALREAFPHAHISLLTTRPFLPLAHQAPWFNTVLQDTRPRWWDRTGLRRLRGHLIGYDLIVDLQTSARSTRYRALAAPTRWSGLIKKDALFHANPWRNEMHTLARQADQLRVLGINTVSRPDTSWLISDGSICQIAKPYVVLVPGAAAHRPGKRWPVARFAALARRLADGGETPVIVGTEAESDLAVQISRVCDVAIDLTGRTDLKQLAALTAGAAWVVGNDTGPMHLAAAVGSSSTVLFSGESDPRLTAPIGLHPGQVSVCMAKDISTISVESVVATRRKIL